MSRRRRWRQRRAHETAELNITAFMNLMVILVPFLLITAVFSRLAVLELNLPGAEGTSAAVDEDRFQLEITVRAGGLEVGDRDTGLLESMANTPEGDYDLSALTEFLKQVKVRFPDKTDATVLLEPDIEYDVLVQVMDAVRVEPQRDADGKVIAFGELFPDISVGDAVMPATAAAIPGGGDDVGS